MATAHQLQGKLNGHHEDVADDILEKHPYSKVSEFDIEGNANFHCINSICTHTISMHKTDLTQRLFECPECREVYVTESLYGYLPKRNIRIYGQQPIHNQPSLSI